MNFNFLASPRLESRSLANVLGLVVVLLLHRPQSARVIFFSSDPSMGFLTSRKELM
jgi:hypothetical protein